MIHEACNVEWIGKWEVTRAAHIASLVDVLRLGDVLVELLDLLVVEAAEDGGVDAANLVLESERCNSE